ncbi:hypothetical protein UFOVP221_87 [uncultured Caudovirales phage]|uniref:Fibronectin type-III domain-containing protein n=1 Tax=uncultured Caudovirales phage TaxID=2100421 RepID=A0A6J7WNB4_9CAUD|nr:hypothetical protein UFOVP221_87 [uncultured Caudovirales phage]
MATQSFSDAFDLVPAASLILTTTNTYNSTANSSTVTWTLKLLGNNSKYNYGDFGTSWSVTINGDTTRTASGTFAYNFGLGNPSRVPVNNNPTIASGTYPVAIVHNSDGTQAITVAAAADDTDPIGAAATSGTFTFTNEARPPLAPTAAPTISRTGTGTSSTVTSAAAAASSPATTSTTGYHYRASLNNSAWPMGTQALTSGSSTANSGTVVFTAAGHTLLVGDAVTISGTNKTEHNLTDVIVTAVTSSTFTVTRSNAAVVSDVAVSSTSGTATVIGLRMGTGTTNSVVYPTSTSTTVYYFQTRARNSEGPGAWSATGVAYAAPTITATSSVGPTASVTVAPPSNDGGSTISSHTVEYSLDSTFATGVSTSTVAGSAGGTATINNLTPGRTWYFRAKYTNAASATSPYSNTTSTFIAAYGRRYQTVTVTGVTAVGSSTTYTTGSAHGFSLNDPVSVTGLTSTYNASGTVTAVTTTLPFSFTLGSTTPTTTSGTVSYTGTGTGAGWALMTTGKRYDANGTSPGVPGWVDVGTAQRYDSTGVWKAFS